MTDTTDSSTAAEALAQDAEIVRARLARQSNVETVRNPLPRLDYLCKVVGSTVDGGAALELRYVPDKLLLQEDAFGVYLAGLPDAESLESLAAMVLDDLNNELVPRFLQIRVRASEDELDSGHAVLMEDRRPRWDNPALLSRLPAF
ncbi:MAG: hypothetical protein RLW87_05555 [Alphaproteobacteria bacterium]|jgi:7-cyano-7-deazaguanine reductase|uniref:hypothetical protein n=1 Tax=Pacificispira sp. TaxID=2888761 RepID=UPI001B032E1D|nr:hypothetical protein [Alphaproteobacteria bacterium]MEC9266627.1 hypothetical protein [Pseudomonadota bacterium]